jgi:hypothetical protein
LIMKFLLELLNVVIDLINHQMFISTMNIVVMRRTQWNQISWIIVLFIFIVMMNSNHIFLRTTHALFLMVQEARCPIFGLLPIWIIFSRSEVAIRASVGAS